jgi:segregation and condensation protein A
MEPSSTTQTYEFQIGEFKGPLDKLLELIEAEKMDINSVSLAKVTDGFLHYLDDLKSAIGVAESTNESGEKIVRPFRADLHLLADFVAVASRLIFLKSKYLLPGLELTEEEEADIKDLESRLKIYQDLKPAIRMLNKLWHESHRSYSRPYLIGKGSPSALASDHSLFYPGTNLTLEGLTQALEGIFESIKTYELETDTIKEKIVTLEEKISEVLARVQKEGDMHFKNLSGDKSRGETIVVFLALLHLAREQLVLLEQLDAFSDIIVKKK